MMKRKRNSNVSKAHVALEDNCEELTLVEWLEADGEQEHGGWD